MAAAADAACWYAELSDELACDDFAAFVEHIVVVAVAVAADAWHEEAYAALDSSI